MNNVDKEKLENGIQHLIETKQYCPKSEVWYERGKLIQDQETKLARLDASIMRGLSDAESSRLPPAEQVFERLQTKYCNMSSQKD